LGGDAKSLQHGKGILVEFAYNRLAGEDEEVVGSSLPGLPIEQPVYSFSRHNRTGDTILVQPRKVMIVEGILIMTNAQIRDMFDIKIFVHADTDERLIRRIRRDINERGRDIDEVLTRYQTTLKPMHDQFIEPTKEFADIIIPNNKYNTVAIDIVKTIINEKLV